VTGKGPGISRIEARRLAPKDLHDQSAARRENWWE
jgi:hypothetical protein